MNNKSARVGRGRKSLGVAAVCLACLVLFASTTAYARSQYLTDWRFFYEGFSTLATIYGCGVCHVPDSTDYTQFNPYGADIRSCVAAGGFVDDCALQIENIDSDGDAYLNVDEIYFDSHPGIPGPPEPCEDMDLDMICDDGDHSGVTWDNPCTCGNTQNCDDNCIFIYNPLQEDCDCDGIGNPCDVDDDGDGYDVISAPPLWDCNDTCGVGAAINPGAKEICGNAIDENCDTIVEPAGPDLDGDGVPDCRDPCPGVFNPDQGDMDGDGLGDLCDPDMDGDGLLNVDDPVEFMVPDGDVNRDGEVNIADVLLAQRIVSGDWVPGAASKHMADVAQYLSGGIPDKVVDMTDVLKISRMAGMGQ